MLPSSTPIQRITRLAPSPTGALHLGNARTFLINWAVARLAGWKILLRMEDLDGPRIKTGADVQVIEDLSWLGINWDEGPAYQRVDLEIYRTALLKLSDAGLAYGCTCTRREIQNALSAPHGDEHELRYPGTCRGQPVASSQRLAVETAVRFCVPSGKVSFMDEVAGAQCVDVGSTSGDFIIWTKAGLPAYQLAVVVDDQRQGVTDVIRGNDLIDSTGRQLLLYEALGTPTPPPRWWHLPLVLGTDGKRLAKRHGDTRLAWYRGQGVSSQRLIGLLASLSGVTQKPEPMDAQQFKARFELARLPRQAVTFTAEMHQWLLSEK